MTRPGALRRLAALLLALAAVAAAPGLLRLRVDNSPEVFFVRDAERLRDQESFEALFDGGRGVRIALRAEDLWTADGLAALAAVEAAAGETPGVRRTAGLWSRHHWLLPEWPPPDAAGFRRRVLADPLDRAAGWVAADGSVVTVLAAVEPEAHGPEVVEELEAAAKSAVPPGFEVTLAGLPVLERAMDRSLRRLLRLHVPVLLAAAVVLLVVGFRSVAAAAAPLGFLAVVIAGALGAMGLLGLALDMVSVVLVPLLLVISLATALHLEAGYRHELGGGASREAAMTAAYRRKGPAVVWAAATTAAAFASFALSPVPPVRALGLWLAAGIAWMLLVAFGLYPYLLKLTAVGPSRSAPSPAAVDRRLGAAGRGLAAFAERHRGRILVVFGVLAALALAGAAGLERESGLLSYFAPEHPARSGVERLEAVGLAAAAAELVIELPVAEDGAESFREPERLEALAALADGLRRIPGVRGAIGAGDLYRAALADVVLEGAPTPAVRWMVLGVMQSDATVAAALDELLAREGRATRITLGVPLAGPEVVEPLLESARETAERAFPGARVVIAGELPLILATQRRLLGTLAVSLLLTLTAVVVILAAIVRDRRTAWQALLPNLWAVLVVFGAMGAAGVPLDSTTVMIAAVALGLAVDDTLHTLAELRAATGGERRPLAAALGRVVPAHVLTSVVLAAGFAVCALSDFLPVARFGGLAVVGVAAALAGDLLLLPALLARD